MLYNALHTPYVRVLDSSKLINKFILDDSCTKQDLKKLILTAERQHSMCYGNCCTYLMNYS